MHAQKATPPQGLALLLRHVGRYGEGALYPLACDDEAPPDDDHRPAQSGSDSNNKHKKKKKQPTTAKIPRRRKRVPALPPHLMREGLWAPGEGDRPVHRLRLLEPGAAWRAQQRQQQQQEQGEEEAEAEGDELTARPFFSPFQHWTQPHVAAPSLVLDLTTPAGGALFLRPLEEVRCCNVDVCGGE